MAHRGAYRRILLKLSGEALMGAQQFGVEHAACQQIAQAIVQVHALGLEVGLVVGGGNIFRGTQAAAFNLLRTPADHVGMLATVINGLLLQQSLAALGIRSRVVSAFNIDPIVEPYHWGNTMQWLSQGEIVIFVGGTGNPYFTTDSAAALRASEIQAQVLLKATKVDGVFSADPKKDLSAKKFDKLSYSDVLSKDLGVMDATAVALCRDNNIPISVFNVFEPGALLKAAQAQPIGTLITGK